MRGLFIGAVLCGMAAAADPASTPRSRSAVLSGGGASVSGASPISVTSNVVSCIPASGVSGGCLTSGAQTIAGSKTFSGDVTTQADLHTAYLFNTSGIYVGSNIQPLTAAGLNIKLTRNTGDDNCGLCMNVTNSHGADGIAANYVNELGQEQWRIANIGTHQCNGIGGDGGVRACVLDASGGTMTTLGCVPGTTGCQVTFDTGMYNNSVHGAVEWGNGLGVLPDGGDRTQRTGGMALRLSGRTTSDNVDMGGIVGQDNRGNLRPGKMLVTRVSNVNLPRCGIGCLDGGCGTVPKIEFDNSSTTVEDGTGSFDGVLGSMAFNPNSDQIALCTSASYTADAGYEYVLTNANASNYIAPSHFNAYYDGQVIGAATVAAESRLDRIVTGARLTFMSTKAGADGAHTFTVDAYDKTTSTVLCVTGSITCNDPGGGLHGVACSTSSGAIGDDVQLRVNDANCITVSQGNIAWEYR